MKDSIYQLTFILHRSSSEADYVFPKMIFLKEPTKRFLKKALNDRLLEIEEERANALEWESSIAGESSRGELDREMSHIGHALDVIGQLPYDFEWPWERDAALAELTFAGVDIATLRLERQPCYDNRYFV